MRVDRHRRWLWLVVIPLSLVVGAAFRGTTGGPRATPVIVGRVALDRRMGLVSVYRVGTGHLLDTFRIPPGGADMVAVFRSRRVFVFHGGKVSVVDTTTGRLVRTAIVGGLDQYGPAVVDQRSGRVFLADGRDGRVAMLDGMTGDIVRTVAVGTVAFMPVYDERKNQIRVWSVPGGAGNLLAGHTSVLDGDTGTLILTLSGNNGAGIWGPATATLVDATDPWGWLPPGLRRHLAFVPQPPPPMKSPYTIDLSYIR